MKKSIFALVVMVGIGSPLMAQTKASAGNLITINGIVKSSEGQRLRAAEVIAGELRAITNDSGAFTLRNVPGGSVFLFVRRIGFLPGTLSFDTDPSLREVSIEARLVPSVVALGTVIVEGKTLDRQLWQNGYYKRKTLGDGVFFDPERMKQTAANLSSILQEVPQVLVQSTRGGTRVAMARSFGGVSMSDLCPLSVFVDGEYFPWADEVGIDDIVAQQEVKAMEVYPRRLPASLRGSAGPRVGAKLTPKGVIAGGTDCGAVLLWTKSIEEMRAERRGTK